jgi:hypothetical protein
MDAVDIDSDVIATIEQLKLDVEKLVLNYSVNTPEHLLDDKKMSIIVPENLHHNEGI